MNTIASGMLEEQKATVIQIYEPLCKKAHVSLFLQREDLVHPLLSGNKWYKLKYNLEQAKNEGQHTLLTFGGAYSNHIYATAAAGQVYGFKTIGVIRGEASNPPNYTLRQAAAMGMQLHYIDRQSYRHKEEESFAEELHRQFGNYYLLPEGGANALAVKGCMEIARYAADYDYACVSMGTGSTLAGMAVAMNGTGKLLGFPALKNGSFLMDEVHQLTQAYAGKTFDNIQLIDQYHFGGYARFKPSLIDFINAFIRKHQILLDPVYTGKMLYGIYDMVRQGFFPAGSRILAIHSGGLQGVHGYNERFGYQQPILGINDVNDKSQKHK